MGYYNSSIIGMPCIICMPWNYKMRIDVLHTTLSSGYKHVNHHALFCSLAQNRNVI